MAHALPAEARTFVPFCPDSFILSFCPEEAINAIVNNILYLSLLCSNPHSNCPPFLSLFLSRFRGPVFTLILQVDGQLVKLLTYRQSLHFVCLLSAFSCSGGEDKRQVAPSPQFCILRERFLQGFFWFISDPRSVRLTVGSEVDCNYFFQQVSVFAIILLIRSVDLTYSKAGSSTMPFHLSWFSHIFCS